MPEAPEWLQSKYSSRIASRLGNGEMMPADMRNWRVRNYLRIPGVGWGESDSDDGSITYEWPHIYVLKALFLARAKSEYKIPYEKASIAFLKRISDVAELRSERLGFKSDEGYHFFDKIRQVLLDHGPPEFEFGRYKNRKTKYRWLIPTVNDEPRPLEIVAVQSARVEETVKRLKSAKLEYNGVINIDITDIVRTIKENIARLDSAR